MDFSAQLSLQSVSFGQANYAILREFYRKGLNPDIFPIGASDASAQNLDDKDFFHWLTARIQGAEKNFKRSNPNYRLWHPQGSQESVGKEQVLFTFHECNALTPTETNLLSNQARVLVSSRETERVFNVFGVKNTTYCPLGFDRANFHRIEKQYYPDTVIVFGLSGKLESRKNTLRTLKLWADNFGNDRRYQLKCLIFNPFLDETQQKHLIDQTLGKRYWNINFLPRLKTNAEVNDYLNMIDICLDGLSSFEGFNLPLFHALAIGKQAVVLNAHVHRDYCNESNSFLVEPSGMRPASDGIWFKPGESFNQGSWYEWEDEAALKAIGAALEVAKERNVEGEKLREEFSYERTANIIAEEIKKVS